MRKCNGNLGDKVFHTSNTVLKFMSWKLEVKKTRLSSVPICKVPDKNVDLMTRSPD
jgi:hypothetical protein